MATLNFKSSSELGPVFQDSVYPSWLHGGESDSCSTLLSNRFNGTACNKANGRYVTMLAQASSSNFYSSEDDYEHIRPQPPKSTDPGNQTHGCIEEQTKNYQQHGNIEQDFRSPKCSDFSARGCGENTGFMPLAKDFSKTLSNSSMGVYRISNNLPIPKNNLMTWSKSDIQLLNQFASSASLSHSSGFHDAHITSLKKQSSFDVKQSEMVLLDFQGKCEGENLLLAQQPSDSLLAYDPRWTFGKESNGKTENCDNDRKELVSTTYPRWESDTETKKSPLTLQDEKSSFASSRLHSIYATATNKESNSAFEEKDMTRGKGENLLLNQDVFDNASKELYEGLKSTADPKYKESSANKGSDSETSSTDSSSSRFYYSTSKSSPERSHILFRPANKIFSSSEQVPTDSTPSCFQISDYKAQPSSQKSKSAKPHPIIKSINELLEDPYDNSECVFCKGNDQTEEVYLSHPIRVDNIVVCPYLRKYVCAICKSTGDGAHTIKYCPFNKRGFFAMREKFPPPNKSLRTLDQDTILNGLKKGKTVQNIWKPKTHRFELDPCRSDQGLYSSTSSLTSNHSTTSSSYSDVVSNNRLFFQNLEKLRKNPKKQDIGCRST